MKKSFLLTLLFCLFTANVFAQPLTKVSGKQLYKTTLGTDNDEVIIGDPKSISFVPQIELKKWGGENSLTIKPTGQLALDLADATPTLVNGKLEISKGKVGWYANPDPDNTDRVKFGLILYEDPITKKWQFQIEGLEDLDVLYQRPLNIQYPVGFKRFKEYITSSTETEAYVGAKLVSFCEEDIVGSYAICKGWKKLGQIYRPKLIDGDGKFLGWVNLHIENGIYELSIEHIPQDIIDNAKLPLIFNDTVGTTSIGSISEQTDGSLFLGTKFTSSGSGTGSYGKACYWYSGSGHQISMTLYTDSSGTPNALVANSASGAVTVTRTTKPTQDSEWTQCNNTPAITAQVYWVTVYCGTPGDYIAREDGAASQSFYNYAADGHTNPPATQAPEDYLAWQMSLYENYTPSGGAASPLKPIVNIF